MRVCLGLVAVLLGQSSSLHAATDAGAWRYCRPAPRLQLPEPLPEAAGTRFLSDRAEIQDDRYRLQGNVFGQRAGVALYADRLLYDAQTELVQAEGDVRYLSGSQLLRGTRADLRLGMDSGELSGVRFWLPDRHLRGSAETLGLDGPERMQLRSGMFTTCDEGLEFWRLRAGELTLDQAENVGVAKHVRLELLHVPVFYSPYLSFPLQGRKSGLLFPTYGETSRSGREISVPWYFNIAPDKDATLTPTYLSRRGMQWGGEFRYLNARSRGDILLSYLPGDRLYGADRGAVVFRHSGEPAAGWRTELKIQRVSDDDYLSDFGKQLNVTSVTHLESRADLGYENRYGSASLMVQDYQALGGPSTTYARLPQFRLNMTPQRLLGKLDMDLRAEAVRFDRELGVTGSRLDIQPGLSLPLESGYGFLTPRLAFRHTQYALQGTEDAAPTRPVRNLPLLSVDSGLFFEREMAPGGTATLQTLEPRLYYLYVPYVDQDALNLFDTSLPLLTLGQIFRDNRFNGADRVGDANQLSAALSSRFLAGDGRELANLTLGRIVYFSDRRVGLLPGAAPQTEAASNWLADVSANWLPSLSARASLEWNQPTRAMDRGNISLRYHPAARRAVNLGYRFERDRLEQYDVSAMWPLWQGLSAMALHRYSLQDRLVLESAMGLEYESCCWTFRLLKRNYRTRADEPLTNTFWLQLELKGLSSVGRNVAALLERDILAP